MRLVIGVLGSSGGAHGAGVGERAFRLGQAIAEHDAILITGGCPGLPHEAVRGAKAKGGFVVGVSPGLSIEEHRRKYWAMFMAAGASVACVGTRRQR